MTSLLMSGRALPVFGVVMFAIVVWLNPGHDLLFDVPSALGTAGAPYPALFNLPLLGMAVTCLMLGPAIASGLQRNGSDRALSVLTGLSTMLGAAYFVFVALYPLPHPWHRGLRLNLAGYALPIAGLYALRSGGRCIGLQRLLGAVSVTVTVAGVMGGLIVGSGWAPRPAVGLYVTLCTLAYFMNVAALCQAVLPTPVPAPAPGRRRVRPPAVPGSGRLIGWRAAIRLDQHPAG